MRLKKQILIVDTDAFLAGIYARRFELGHWKVRVAENIEDARKLIKDKHPSVMIIDVETVPESINFLKEVRSDSKTADITLIVLTKLGDRDSIKQALDAGADSYLLKGHFVPSEVREKIERLVS